MDQEAYDFIKASSVALIKNQNYKLVRVGASLARQKGPQLVRRKQHLEGRVLGVPSLSSTAALLARKYFPQLEQKAYPLNALSPMLIDGRIPYALIINEDMNRLDDLGLESVCDLGLRWNQEFNANLPLGLFGFHARLKDRVAREFESKVHASVCWARENLNDAIDLSQNYAGEVKVNAQHIQLFTQDAHFNPSLLNYVEKLKNSLGLSGKEAF